MWSLPQCIPSLNKGNNNNKKKTLNLPNRWLCCNNHYRRRIAVLTGTSDCSHPAEVNNRGASGVSLTMCTQQRDELEIWASAVMMSSVQSSRQFISERLSAAAAEISAEFVEIPGPVRRADWWTWAGDRGGNYGWKVWLWRWSGSDIWSSAR